MTKKKTITYVEFGSTGHRPIWIRAVIGAFEKLETEWCLRVWVPREFAQLHHGWCGPYLDKNEHSHSNIAFKFHDKLIVPGKARSNSSRFEVARRCAEADRAQVCFLANNLDACMKDIAFSRPDACKAKLVGVLDQPFLHYIRFSSGVTKRWLSARMYLSAYLKTFLMCHRPAVAEILMLDPLAPSFYKTILGSPKFHYLPEYVTEIEPIANSREHFGLPKDRKILLLAGAISRHKGVVEFLDGLRIALKSRELRDQVCVVLAGRVEPDVRDDVFAALSDLCSLYTTTPVLLFDRFLTELEFVSLVSASDVVCLPYMTTPTTSGLLMHAAAHGRIVLTRDFGIVGELVRRYHLGVLYEQPTSEGIAKGVYKCMDVHHLSKERCQMLKNFAARYSVPLGQFGKLICDSLVKTAVER